MKEMFETVKKMTGAWRKDYVTKRQAYIYIYIYTGCFTMFSVITNIYNKKTKVHTLMELFTATGKMKKSFFLTTRDVRCVHHW